MWSRSGYHKWADYEWRVKKSLAIEWLASIETRNKEVKYRRETSKPICHNISTKRPHTARKLSKKRKKKCNRTIHYSKAAFFWDYYSGIGILGIDGICVLLGAIPFSEWTEYHSVHSAPDSRMNRMQGMPFTRNRQNTRYFGKSYAAAHSSQCSGHPRFRCQIWNM